ncbi:43kDa postsynaptic protein [Abeliophyllum distichum]|uniref:RING-type E3 ubiquitin transferase n=1 Tax=Abeliophyllum distichum TaxID=126358 RepID=A0ABD1QLZ8_9LAMI
MDLTCSIAVQNSGEPHVHNVSPSKIDVVVNFHCHKVERMLYYGDDGQLRVITEDPESKISGVASFDFAMPFKESKQILLAELENYDIKCKEFEENVVDELYKYAHVVFKDCRDFSLTVTINQHIDYVVVPLDEEISDLHMIPASIDAITSLPRKKMNYKIDDGEVETCTICFEEIAAGSLVATLPCSHLFHDGCISEWLKRSHYCPNCRFEMPTTRVDDLIADRIE